MHILAVYGSNTGNTKSLMYFIKEYFKSHKYKFTLLNAKDINAENIPSFSKHDLVILSSATWGGVQPTLQEDFAAFWSLISKNNFKDNKFAVIGLGDIYYPSFCKAVDFISDDVVKYKGSLLINSLAIADSWEDYKPAIKNWLQQLQNILKQQ